MHTISCISAYDVTIPAEGKVLVKTDIAIALPEGCYGRVGRWAHVISLVTEHVDHVILAPLAQRHDPVCPGSPTLMLEVC